MANQIINSQVQSSKLQYPKVFVDSMLKMYTLLNKTVRQKHHLQKRGDKESVYWLQEGSVSTSGPRYLDLSLSLLYVFIL